MTNSKDKFSRTKIDKMFWLGYKLAFETKERRKDWNDIFSLWYCAATGGDTSEHNSFWGLVMTLEMELRKMSLKHLTGT
jgi:hypothetical protein